MSLSPVRRVRQELKSSKNTTFCTRYLNFTAHLKSSLVFCINIGQYLFKGRNYTENGPNGVELWLKTFSFWLDLRPTRSGLSTKKKWKKNFFSSKKWTSKKSIGIKRVLQESHIRSQIWIWPRFAPREWFWILRNFFWIPPIDNRPPGPR